MGVATLYGIRNCDTVKKARAWLEERGIAYRFHDYKLPGVEPERMRRWCRELGWEVLLNRAGTTFRKVPERNKRDLDEERVLALMTAQPSVIKRPVLELGPRLMVGFKPELHANLVR